MSDSAAKDPRDVPFPGIELTLGGRVFIIPPISVRDMKLQSRRLAKAAKASRSKMPTTEIFNVEDVDLAIDLVHKAILRNYRDVTRDELLDLLDGPSLLRAVDAIAGKKSQ